MDENCSSWELIQAFWMVIKNGLENLTNVQHEKQFGKSRKCWTDPYVKSLQLRWDSTTAWYCSWKGLDISNVDCSCGSGLIFMAKIITEIVVFVANLATHLPFRWPPRDSANDERFLYWYHSHLPIEANEHWYSRMRFTILSISSIYDMLDASIKNHVSWLLRSALRWERLLSMAMEYGVAEKHKTTADEM